MWLQIGNTIGVFLALLLGIRLLYNYIKANPSQKWINAEVAMLLFGLGYLAISNFATYSLKDLYDFAGSPAYYAVVTMKNIYILGLTLVVGNRFCSIHRSHKNKNSMSSSPQTGAVLPQARIEEMKKNYREMHPNEIHGHFFSTSFVKQFADHPDSHEIHLDYAYDENGEKTLCVEAHREDGSVIEFPVSQEFASRSTDDGDSGEGGETGSGDRSGAKPSTKG